MKQIILWIIILLSLQNCSSTSKTNLEDDIEVSVDKHHECIVTYNLQVGEKATYRFNIQGEISDLSAEVISENNESYVIGFTEANKAEIHLSWLKGCQSQETLQAVEEDTRRTYILTGIFSINNYNLLNDNSLTNSNTVQDTATVSTGTFDKSEEWLEEFSVKSRSYNLVLKTLIQYSNSDLFTYAEQYTFEYGENLGINTPFGDHLKDVIGFVDDTNVTIELIYWNGL